MNTTLDPKGYKPALVRKERRSFLRDYGPLYKGYLSGRLWHCTDLVGYVGIREFGSIVQGARASEWANAYGNKKGYICLFDFRGLTYRHVIPWHSSKWARFFRGQRVALELDVAQLSSKVIPNRQAFEEEGFYKSNWIPYVEAWYPEPIPIAAVVRYLFLGRSEPIEVPSDDPAHEQVMAWVRGHRGWALGAIAKQ